MTVVDKPYCAPVAQPMDLGFETIGNATVVVHDREPVLATDPWIEGSAYFGSWGLSHPVPPALADSILAAGAVWFSHGHPDHLNPASLPRFRDTRILLPDHVGGRIARDLTADGYRVEVLPDATWVRISDRVRVLCIADEGQDAVLLIDVGGRARREPQRRAGPRLGSAGEAGDQGLPSFVPHAPERVRRRRHDQFRRRRRSAPAQRGAAPSRARVRGRRRRRAHDRDVRRDALRALQLVPPLPAHRQRVGQRVDHAGRRVRAWASGPIASTLLPAFVRYDVPTGVVGRRSTRPRRPTSRSRPRSSATTGPSGSSAPTSIGLRGYFTGGRTAGPPSRPGRRPRRRRGARGGARWPRHRTVGHVRSPPRVVDARGRVGDLRRPPHRQLHDDHAARPVAELAPLSRVHAVGHQVRRQRTGAHRRRAAGLLRRVPPPPRARPRGCGPRSSSAPRTRSGLGSRPIRRCTSGRVRSTRGSRVRPSRSASGRARANRGGGGANAGRRARRRSGDVVAGRSSRSAAASASASPGATASAVPGVARATISGGPPWSVVTTGVPLASASTSTSPYDSGSTDGSASTSRSAMTSGMSSRGSRSCAPGVPATRAAEVGGVAVLTEDGTPDDHEARSSGRSGARPRRTHRAARRDP